MDEAFIRNLMERYRRLFPDDPMYEGNLRSVETALGVILPQDIEIISAIYDGGSIGGMPNYHLRPTNWGYDVVNRTLSLRDVIHLPHCFIVLAELDESIVFLKTMKTDKVPTPIYWIDSPNAKLLTQRDPLPTEVVRIFEDFTSYFAFLVEEEEQERTEDWYTPL